MTIEHCPQSASFFTRLDRYLNKTLRIICSLCLAILLVLLAGNVFVRYFPVAAFYWFDEVVEWVFAWMVFLGAAALWTRDEHFKLSWLDDKLEGTIAGNLITLFIELICLIFLMIFFIQAAKLTYLAKDWTPVFNVPRRCLYICMPISGLIMVSYSLANSMRAVKELARAFALKKNKDDQYSSEKLNQMIQQ